MEMIPVRSSTIEAVGYDETSLVLHVRFLSGGTYEYIGVPQTIFQQLIQAPSKGSFFDTSIKKAGYLCRRIL
jgi:KTSC domain